MKKNALFLFLMCMFGLAQSLSALPVSNGLVIHLDAGAITGVADGDAIGTWSDLSGAGNDAVQLDAGLQPVYVANSAEFNGNAVLQFDGTDDSLALPNPAPFNVGSVTMFAVAKYNSFSDADQYIVAGQDGGGNDRIRFAYDYRNTSFVYRIGDTGWKDMFADADNGVHIFGINSTAEGFLDGGSVATSANSSTETPVALNIGSYNNGEKDFLNGQIAELVIFDRVLDASEMDEMNDYLAAKYVPEPSTMALLGLGSLALRRRK